MTAKEYLAQARTLDNEINCMTEQLANLRRLATRSTSILQEVSVTYTMDVHSREEAIAGMVDLDRQITEEVRRLVALKQEILQVIMAVKDPTQRNLLRHRYLQMMSWQDICKTMRYSRSRIMKIHRTALAAVQVPDNK